MKPADDFLIVLDMATYQPKRSELVSYTPDDLRYREARNVDEVLIQMPMEGEVVVKVDSHLAIRVYREDGKFYIEHLGFMGAEPLCLMVPLTEAQGDLLAAALSSVKETP